MTTMIILEWTDITMNPSHCHDDTKMMLIMNEPTLSGKGIKLQERIESREFFVHGSKQCIGCDVPLPTQQTSQIVGK